MLFFYIFSPNQYKNSRWLFKIVILIKEGGKTLHNKRSPSLQRTSLRDYHVTTARLGTGPRLHHREKQGGEQNQESGREIDQGALSSNGVGPVNGHSYCPQKQV